MPKRENFGSTVRGAAQAPRSGGIGKTISQQAKSKARGSAPEHGTDSYVAPQVKQRGTTIGIKKTGSKGLPKKRMG